MQSWADAMRAGRYDDAWAMEIATIAARNPAGRDDPTLPYHQRWVWDGGAPDGKRVLVRCYHGLGDTIQFARYLPLLAKRASTVTGEVQPRLIPLLAGLGVNLVAFDPKRPLPPSECDIEITELPCALRTPPDAFPCPYLPVAAATPRPDTIGLCYAAGEWDAARSIAPELFASLCQKHRCVTLVAEPTRLRVANPQGCPFDIAETAALIAGLDLIVTVDTMIAHLAGAMGRRVWLLLKAQPDWRWDPARTDTPLYPNTRIFAQTRDGDWSTLVQRVEAELDALFTPGKAAQCPD